MSVMEKSTVDLRGRLAYVNEKCAKALQQAGETYDFAKVDDDVLEGSSGAEKLEKFQAYDREANDLGEEIDRRRGLSATGERIAKLNEVEPHPGHSTQGQQEQKKLVSPGAAFAASEDYKRFDAGKMGSSAGIEVPGLNFQAATFDTAGATLTVYERPPGIVLVGTRMLRVANLLATGQTTANTIRFVQEDTFTNAATTVAEGATKPEASWDTSEVDSAVRKIAVTSKVTDELFADFPMIRDYIDNRMRYMVGLTEDDQLLNGNGTPPNLRGILNTSGIQTQALGADTRPDAVYKAMVKVRFTGFFEPDGAVFNPTDWQNIRLLRDANGQYIWGAPSDAGVERIWGLPVVQTPTIAAGTALVGAFQLGAQVWYREGLRVESTNSNEDDFKKNLIAIRAEQREALTVYRPKAFATVTGL
jgi:HK97 family phage major capsid protein